MLKPESIEGGKESSLSANFSRRNEREERTLQVGLAKKRERINDIPLGFVCIESSFIGVPSDNYWLYIGSTFILLTLCKIHTSDNSEEIWSTGFSWQCHQSRL